MLKRFTHLIAAAAAVMIAATPAAEAGDRHGKGYYDRDGGRHYVQRHRDGWRDHKGWRKHKGWKHHAHRGDRYIYRAPRHRHHRAYRYAYRPAPRIVWKPRFRHRHYRDWHHDRYYNLAILFSVLNTVQTGFTQHWHDPDLNVSGSVTPTRTYQLAGGQYCREYQQQIIVDGRPVSGFGRACQQPDGSWQTVN